MSASNQDLITDVRNATRPNSARVSSGRSAGGATLACDNLTGWPTASKVHFVIYQIDSNSNPVSGTQLDCYGIRSGNNITSLVVVDGTDAGNAVNDVVEMLPTAAWGQDLATALTTAHDRLGVHKSGATYDSPLLTGTATGTYTLGGTPTIASPTITGSITGQVVGASNLTTGAITLGYAQITSNFTTASTTAVQATGLTATVTIPAGGRKIKITAFSAALSNTGPNSDTLSIWDGTVGSGTQLSETVSTGAGFFPCVAIAIVTPSAGSKTYNLGLSASAGTATLNAATTFPAFILVEAI